MLRGRGCRAVLGSLAACALTLNAVGAVAEPRPARLAPEPATAEAGLWSLADRSERAAAAAGDRNRDAALNAYVGQILCRVSAEYCQDLRLYVFDRPFFNAAEAPNGYTEVWSGLLLRCEDEAQLAFALGHETSHFAENHSLATFRREALTRDLLLGFTVAVGAVGAYYAVDLSGLVDIAYFSGLVRLFTFSREQEMDADRLGMERARAAGYDPRSASALWRNVSEEQRASSFERVRRREKAPSIFNTHPLTSERLALLDQQTAALPMGGVTERLRYRAAIRPFLGPWLRDDLRRRDWGQTLWLIRSSRP